MAQGDKRQFVRYTFFKVDPHWRRLSDEVRALSRGEFVAVVDELATSVKVTSYSLVGTRADADFMLWQISPSLELLQQLARQLNGTELGKYLSTPHSFLAMTRPSPYVDSHLHPEQEGRGAAITALSRKYLFLYPFVKTHEWYQLPAEERQRMMNEHFVIGHRYPSVKITTAYSFGLDDQEFVLGFETDSAADFLELVMELRGSEARPYTLRDTPIFTCLNAPLQECLDDLG